MENLVEKCGELCDFFIGNFELIWNLGVSVIFESKSVLNVCMELKVDCVGVKLIVFGNFVIWVKYNSGMIVDNVVKELECIFVELFNVGEGNILIDLK